MGEAADVASEIAEELADEIADEIAEEVAEELVDELVDEIAEDIVDELANEMLDENDPFNGPFSDGPITDEDIENYNYLPADYKRMTIEQQQRAYELFLNPPEQVPQYGAEFSDDFLTTDDDLDEDWTEEDSDGDDMSGLFDGLLGEEDGDFNTDLAFDVDENDLEDQARLHDL